MKLTFIGAGKMATALAGGLVKGGVFAVDDVTATDVVAGARAAFTDSTGIQTEAGNDTATAVADVVILAVKPQVAAEVLLPLHGAFDDKLFVSIAAGLSIEKLREWIGSDRVIRVMPNTPALVGQGAAVFACGDGVTADDRDLATRIFDAVGIVCEMDEDKLDAVTGLSGSGPAYVFEMIQAMVDGAVAAGLPADSALDLTVQTVAGAAEMVRQKMGTPDELRTAVTSPGGTTAAGLEVMNDVDFRAIMTQVIARATERSAELGAE